MIRLKGRANDALRPFKIERHFQRHPAGSVLVTMGNTKVVCAATIEDRLPFFIKGTGEGWITAEYSMLPGATDVRSARQLHNGRSQEIGRLIGRSLRSGTDLKALGERSIVIDCDVLEADGGTRTAAITGAFVALVEACETFYEPGGAFPVEDFLAAVSVGISADGEALLDLCYEEDSTAIADINVVMTDSGKLVEVQGTGEKRPFSREELNNLLDLAAGGIKELIDVQKYVLGGVLVWRVGRVG